MGIRKLCVVRLLAPQRLDRTIVEAELWERANNILEGSKPAKQAVQIFAGLAYCSCGGKMMVPSSSPKYICIDCRHKIPTGDLEEIFYSQIKDFEISDEESLNDLWEYLSSKEKRMIIEQICNKIIVGKDTIEIEFGYSPHSLKTAADEQQNYKGNETQLAQPVPAPQSPILDEPLLSEAEAARFLGISKMTLLRRRNNGEIGFFRVGFRVLYSKEKHLMPFLNQCEKENKKIVG